MARVKQQGEERERVAGRWAWVWPMTGVAFVIVLMVGFTLGGEGPELGASGAEVLAYFEDAGTAEAGGALLLLAAALFVLFAGAVHRALRQQEGASGGLSTIVLAGGIITAVGVAAMASLQLALAQGPGEGLSAAGAQALNLLSWNLWAVVSVGVLVLGLSAGITVLRHGGLPRWLGWLAIVTGALFATPAWFVAGPLLLLWVVATSIVLARRAMRTDVIETG